MAEDSAIRDASLPVSWTKGLVKHGPTIMQWGALLTLLFSEPARSTRLIFPVRAASIRMLAWEKRQTGVLLTLIFPMVRHSSLDCQNSVRTRRRMI